VNLRNSFREFSVKFDTFQEFCGEIMHFFREFGWSLLTPRDDIVDSVVWFSGEYGQNESVVKMHSFEEHPGEHRQVRILHATDQQLAHHGLYTADTE